jgi:hypothetical protein
MIVSVETIKVGDVNSTNRIRRRIDLSSFRIKWQSHIAEHRFVMMHNLRNQVINVDTVFDP